MRSNHKIRTQIYFNHDIRRHLGNVDTIEIFNKYLNIYRISQTETRE